MFSDKSLPATRITSSWLNAVQEEIAGVIENAGVTLDTQDTDGRDQLWSALQAIGAASPNSTSSTVTETTTTFTMGYGSKHVYLLSPSGADKNWNPSGTFTAGFEVVIINTGSTYNVVFDSSGIGAVITPGNVGIFHTDGTTWY